MRPSNVPWPDSSNCSVMGEERRGVGLSQPPQGRPVDRGAHGFFSHSGLGLSGVLRIAGPMSMFPSSRRGTGGWRHGPVGHYMYLG